MSPAPPAKKNKANEKIEKAARKLNTESKRRLLGKTLEVIAFKSIHKATEEAMIAYPVSEGPVVTLFEKNIKQGTTLKVKITEILSDRLVKGELL